MRVLGLIPARGGSKGVPRKNIKLLKGTPLIGYTIAISSESSLLTKTVVSTNDNQIAKVSKSFGVKVPFMRPENLANDHSPTIETVIHALEYFHSIEEDFDAVCLLQPTVPFRAKGTIDKAIEKFESSGADSLISVQEIPHKYNPSWAFVPSTTPDFLKLATGKEEIIPKRQDLPKSYYRDGSIYITKTSVLLEKKSLYGDQISYFENIGEPLINIDTQEDWLLAEKYAQ